MKTKFLFACLLVSAALFQNAAVNAQDTKPYTTVIQYFIDSHINSDAKKLKEILSDDVTYKIPRQSKVTVQTKNALLAAMQKENGVKQNCTSSSEILSKTDALVIARVDFKYPEFTQQNFLLLERDANNAWKVLQVCKIFNSDISSSSQPATTAY